MRNIGPNEMIPDGQESILSQQDEIGEDTTIGLTPTSTKHTTCDLIRKQENIITKRPREGTFRTPINTTTFTSNWYM